MPTCLIIDDSEIVCNVASAIIETFGYTVSTTSDPAHAQCLCAKTMPDVIVVDWYLPEFDSHQVIGELRTANEKKKPYIIYCTTENDAVDIGQAMSSGADDYMLKPFDRATLEEKFEHISLDQPARLAKFAATN